jgi:DNA-binding IclR family transcriptional regulator
MRCMTMDPDPVGRPAYPIESVDNALRLLLLVEHEGAVRVSHASAHLGVAVSTAHRLLAMLQYYGFVQQDSETKAYGAGPALVRIGVASLHRMDLRGQARPFLERLRNEFDETVHIVIRDGRQILFLDGVESRKAVRVVTRTGSMWAHCTSAGKSMLAEMSDEALLKLYPDEELPTLTSHSISNRTDLLKSLAEVRRQGFAQSQEESEEGVHSVGVAIRNNHSTVVAALSVAMTLTGHQRRKRYIEEVAERARSTAHDIGRALP